MVVMSRPFDVATYWYENLVIEGVKNDKVDPELNCKKSWVTYDLSKSVQIWWIDIIERIKNDIDDTT